MKKRLFSLILAMIIAISGAVPMTAFAGKKQTAQAKYNGNPIVLVRGMNFEGLTYKPGTDEEENCFRGVKAGDVIRVALKAVATGVFRRSYDEAVKVINEYLNDIMGLMACNPDGTSKYDVSVKQYPKSIANYPEIWENAENDEVGILRGAAEKYGAENVYYYNYDWRLDPFIHADNIEKLINTARKDSGKSKVNLVCCSMGGVLTVSYIYKYGISKLNRVLFLSSTVTGTHVTTDLLRGMVEVDADHLYYYTQGLAQDSKPLAFLFKLLYKGGVMKGLCGLVNRLIPHLKDEVFNGFLKDTFGTMPAVWAITLPEGYDEAIKYMFEGQEDKYKGIIELSKKYQKVAAHREKMLLNAEKSGVNICVVAGYNRACIPVYPGGGGNGDAILESDRMLCGAKVAEIGKTLGDDYKAKNPKLVSPDNVVDLSDALFPGTTWAISNGHHVCGDYGSDFGELVLGILGFKGKCTVESFDRFPQFIYSPTRAEFGEF